MVDSDVVHVKCVICGSSFKCDKESLTGGMAKLGHSFEAETSDGIMVRFGAVTPKGDLCPFCALTALASEVIRYLLQIGDIMATPCTSKGKEL